MVRLSTKGLSPEEIARIEEALPAGTRIRRSALLIEGSEETLGAVEQLLERIAAVESRSERVLAVLLEDLEVEFGEERVVQLHRKAELRRRFLREVPMLTSEEIADLRGSRASNRSALATRWRSEGRVFAVRVGNRDYYPAFQFSQSDAAPLPAMARMLALLKGEEPWAIALWLNAPAGWLDGRRPKDVLESDPDRVVVAAERAADPLGI